MQYSSSSIIFLLPTILIGSSQAEIFTGNILPPQKNHFNVAGKVQIEQIALNYFHQYPCCSIHQLYVHYNPELRQK